MADGFLDPRLVGDLRAYAEGGVRSFDAVAIAEGVVGRPRRATNRQSLLLVGIAALVALLGLAVAAGSRPEDEIVVPRYTGEFVPAPGLDGHWRFETVVGLRDGTVLLVGNSTPGIDRNSVILDPVTGAARRLGRLQAARFGPVAVELLDGRVLILGGDGRTVATGDGNIIESIPPTAEILDPVSGESTLAGSLRTPRVGFGAVRLADGRVLLAGGQTLDGTTSLRDAELFDPATGTFTPTAPMVEAHAYPVLVALPDGRAVLRDGPSIEVFDPATATFARLPIMPDAGDGHRLVGLADGRVLALGGSCTEIPRNWNGTAEKRGIVTLDPNQDPVAAWFVDLDSGAVQRLPELPHCVATATALADGTVFVTGWWTDTTLRDTQRGRVADRSVRPWSGIYDPRSGRTRETPAPVAGRYMTVIPLGDGRVLMTDGTTTEILQ